MSDPTELEEGVCLTCEKPLTQERFPGDPRLKTMPWCGTECYEKWSEKQAGADYHASAEREPLVVHIMGVKLEINHGVLFTLGLFLPDMDKATALTLIRRIMEETELGLVDLMQPEDKP